MKYVGVGKSENGNKIYSQAYGSTNLICSKGHDFVTVYTNYALMGLREHTHTQTHTHTHNHFTLIGTAVALWLRCCATNRKVAGSIPDGVIGIFH